jgi:hypothetical protein
MRLDIYGQFVVSVITPAGGWSKGRPIAFIEDGNGRYPADLLIRNGLTSNELELYVAGKYASFAQPGRKIRRLDPTPRAA